MPSRRTVGLVVVADVLVIASEHPCQFDVDDEAQVRCARCEARVPPVRSILLSVVICTRNRADLAAAAVQSVCEQTLPEDRYEILLVDNGSTDHTHAAIVAVQRRYPKHVIRYVREEETGLSHARNRGYREAAGVYVAYLDDDGKAPSHWLEYAQVLIDRHHPDGLGGPILAFFQTDKPVWFKDAYGSFSKTSTPRPLRSAEAFYGGNMFFLKDLLDSYGGFDPNLGMRGYTIGYGEETDFQIRLRVAKPGALLYYDPSLYAFHLVRPEKWSWMWLINARFVAGRQNYHAVPNRSFQETSIAMIVLRTVAKFGIIGWQLSLGALLRNRADYPHVQNYWYERTLRHVNSLGAYYEHVCANRNADDGESEPPSRLPKN